MEKLRALIDKKLNNLPEDDLEQILTFVEFLKWKEREEDRRVPPSFEQQDILIGLFDGPPDLAEQSESLLEQGLEEHSGWTWKTDL